MEKNQSRWQKETLKIRLPADATTSGKEETVETSFRWRVQATKPVITRERNKQEIVYARSCLHRVAVRLDGGKAFSERDFLDIERALTSALRAWCWTNLRSKNARTDNHSIYQAFMEKGPDDLLLLGAEALTAMRRLGMGETSPADALMAVRAVVEPLLKAASHPPRNRRRFPAYLTSFRPIRRPRVRLGSWIDTRRYRPAQVLEMIPDPPHTMKLSYGDETDEDFRPHITEWKTIRKPTRLPSLKDVFSPGDWIRHSYSGYGRVLAVSNSKMDVDYRGNKATLVPDVNLSKIQKVDGPEPDDPRPSAERFPPGTWIDQDVFGQGIVLEIEDDVAVLGEKRTVSVLNVFFVERGVIGISADDEGPIIRKLEREPLDLTQVAALKNALEDPSP